MATNIVKSEPTNDNYTIKCESFIDINAVTKPYGMGTLSTDNTVYIKTEYQDNDDTDVVEKYTSMVRNIPPTDNIKCEPLFVKVECKSDSQQYSDDFKPYNSSQTIDGVYKCGVCHKSFISHYLLIRHSHTGEMPYGTHSRVKPYKCDCCRKQFSQKIDLVIHKRTHTEEKQHKCNVCQKMFAAKRSLRAHMRTHTGERPYECGICHKRFAQNGNLTAHKLTSHNGERPFECNICHQRFSRTRDFSKHARTHIGEKASAITNIHIHKNGI